MEQKKLYTLLVYSENVAGILNQVTAVFTRRQVNIESLNVSASSIPGVHKYTITAWSDEDQIIKIVRQIEKKIDVVRRTTSLTTSSSSVSPDSISSQRRWFLRILRSRALSAALMPISSR